MSKEQIEFLKSLQELDQRIINFPLHNNQLDLTHDILDNAIELQDEIDHAIDKSNEFNKNEMIFQLEVTNYNKLHQCIFFYLVPLLLLPPPRPSSSTSFIPIPFFFCFFLPSFPFLSFPFFYFFIHLVVLRFKRLLKIFLSFF